MANKKDVETKKTNTAKPVEKKTTKKTENKTTTKTTKKNVEPKTTKKTNVENKKEVKETTKKVNNMPKKAETKKAEPTVVEKIEKTVIEAADKTVNTKKEEIEIKTVEVVKDNKVLGIFEKIVILVAVALVFSLLGYFIGNKHNSDNNDYSTATKDLEVLIEQYNKILNEYYEDVDKDKLIKGALSGMLSTLDGYSGVIDDSSNSFSITLEGTYEGLGIEIINNVNGEIEIYNVYDDTPASKAGIKVGDIVTKMNDTTLENISTTDLVKMISENENIKLVLKRGTKEITVELKKEQIELKSVSSEMLDKNIGYIKIDLFANNTYSQFKTALESLEKQNMKSLIIDLRDNTGGHLSSVKDITSLFLDGSHVIYQTQTKTETEKFYSSGNKVKKYNIVILQNEVSASASEILASALREQLNAYIVGKTSYGKGTVQQLETLEGIGQYKFTTKKWLTSKGEWINEKGIAPDLEVSLTEEYYKNPTKKNDLQLQEAIKYLKEK